MSAEPVLSDETYKRFSTIRKLRSHLRELKSCDLSNKTRQEISDIFDSYIFPLPVLTGIFPPNDFNRIKFYRVRLNVDLEKEDRNLIQTYAYPLPQFCKSNGRLNLKNKSIFYCSNHAITAIMESKPKAGETGYLTIWEGNTNRDMDCGILLPRNLRKENAWLFLSNGLFSYLESYIEKTFPKKAAFFNETIDFISDLFLTENAPYHLTSFIADSLFYVDKPKDFVIYPSFENDSYSCNMAIHPNVVTEHLRFIKALKFTVVDDREDELYFTTGEVGELIGSRMNWRVANKEELDFFQFPI